MITRDLDSFGEVPGPDQGPMPKFRSLESRTALNPSKLPGLDFALNPYQGCGHDCVYCFAPAVLRIDRARWATDIGARLELPRLLAQELRSKQGVIGLGTVTDPYQPLEAYLKLTRKCLEELVKARSRVSLLTKSDLAVRDLDLLQRLPQAEIGLTITTSDERNAKLFEPGAPSPRARLQALKEFSYAGMNTYVLIGPLLPSVTDADLEGFMTAIVESGTKRVMTDRLRLRPGLVQLFQERLSPSQNGLNEFMRGAEDQDRMSALDRRIEHCSKRYGLRYERAF